MEQWIYLEGVAFAIIGAWMLYFFITYCGLTPVEAGSIIAIARIIDALASPLMGHITDNLGRTKLGKKFGRRRFFLLVGSPLMVIYSLLWISDMNYWYYLTVYILLEFLAAMVLIPFETLGAEMTNDFNARTKLSTIRLIYSGLGNIFSYLYSRQIIRNIRKRFTASFSLQWDYLHLYFYGFIINYT
ncbi:MFS transporter [Bacillus safensis]|uniref:MFS transporter n=1 Tax=Bacillus safensis TaxID=561879 RepID=UPI003F59F20F